MAAHGCSAASVGIAVAGTPPGGARASNRFMSCLNDEKRLDMWGRYALQHDTTVRYVHLSKGSSTRLTRPVRLCVSIIDKPNGHCYTTPNSGGLDMCGCHPVISRGVADVTTEDINPRTVDIDLVSTAEMLRRINAEDARVAEAVGRELVSVEAVVERVVAALTAGGRLIYVGAGTSGRLGVLDAAECPPTYGTDPRQVQAVLAGGPVAMTRSVEAAEDDEEQGAGAVETLGVGTRDVVLGIASSGRTPYVVGALRRARARGSYTAALVGNADGPVAAMAHVVIAPQTGPEVVAGSTRLKAGTAQKLVLNMISTAVMIRMGHTLGNLMVDMRATNTKLRARAQRIVVHATGRAANDVARALGDADGEVKTAIVMLRADIGADEARYRLARAHGVVRGALVDERGVVGRDLDPRTPVR